VPIRRYLPGVLACVFAVPLLVPTYAAAEEAAPEPPPEAEAEGASRAPEGVESGEYTISCEPSGDNVHKSSHVPGTVNVIVKVNCTAPVAEIFVTAGLEHWNGAAWELVSTSGPSDVGESSGLSENAATTCRTGWWIGWISYEVVFPPGFAPPDGGSQGTVGKQVHIKKC
jgi:hypothetical protein